MPRWWGQINAHPVEGGYLFIPVYGSQSDWVHNVLAAGHGHLTIGGRDIELTAPRLVDVAEAWQALPSTVRRPPRFLRIREYLLMDVEGQG